MATKSTVAKFEKGGFYLDGESRVFVCTNARQRKGDDDRMLVEMKATKDGKPAGKAADSFADTFVQKLSKKELAEHLEVEAREADALAAAAQQPEPDAAAEKPARKPRKQVSAEGAEKKLSGLDAAAKVLGEAGEPLSCQAMVDAMLAQGYWQTGGKTPAATLYSAILRELQTKGAESRFVKTERGRFALAGK
jgi:ribosomal protein L12E/L44/L45/RPP1/RPP2